MTHVAITCPRLLFTLGLSVTPPPGRRDPMPPLVAALDELGARRRGGGFEIDLVDSVDAVLALQALEHALPDFAIAVHSIVACAAAVELLGDVIAARAWDPLLAQITARQPLELSRGLAAARHFRSLVAWPVPAAISDQGLPDAPLVLWQVDAERIVVVDHEPFIIGRDPMCDLSIAADYASRKHLSIARSNEGWRIRDLGSSGGFAIDGERAVGDVELHRGTVIQLAQPTAIVVLAIRP